MKSLFELDSSQGLGGQCEMSVCHCPALHETVQQEVWGRLPTSPLPGPCPQPVFRLFEEPCQRGRSHAEMGFGPILTQQSSRNDLPTC